MPFFILGGDHGATKYFEIVNQAQPSSSHGANVFGVGWRSLRLARWYGTVPADTLPLVQIVEECPRLRKQARLLFIDFLAKKC